MARSQAQLGNKFYLLVPKLQLGNANFRRSSASPPYRLFTPRQRSLSAELSAQSLDTKSGLLTFLAISARQPIVRRNHHPGAPAEHTWPQAATLPFPYSG